MNETTSMRDMIALKQERRRLRDTDDRITGMLVRRKVKYELLDEVKKEIADRLHLLEKVRPITWRDLEVIAKVVLAGRPKVDFRS
jgi:hypothetical protein